MRHSITALMLALASGVASAHAGHGFLGPHFHATDLVIPCVLLVAIVGAAWSRRK